MRLHLRVKTARVNGERRRGLGLCGFTRFLGSGKPHVGGVGGAVMSQMSIRFMATVVVLAMLYVDQASGQTITQIIDSTGDGAGKTLSGSEAVAVDDADNVYVLGNGSDNAFKITPGGVVTQIIDGAGDGAGNPLDSPLSIAMDGAGNAYVTGFVSHNAFRITPGGVVTEIIDSTGDGAGNSLTSPLGIAVDGSGNVYIAGFSSQNAFRITPGGVITQIIDSTGDGAGNTLNAPYAVAVDHADNVYLTAIGTNNAFRITPGGVVTEIIDSTGDGLGNSLSFPKAVAVDDAGNVFVAGDVSDNAFKITPGGVITEIIDNTGDGAGNVLDAPQGIAVDVVGGIYVSGFNSNNVFRIASDGAITEIIDAAGAGPTRRLDGPRGVAVNRTANSAYVTGFFSDNAFEITLCGSGQVEPLLADIVEVNTAGDTMAVRMNRFVSFRPPGPTLSKVRVKLTDIDPDKLVPVGGSPARGKFLLLGCFGGLNDGKTCTSNGDCPGGTCIFNFTELIGTELWAGEPEQLCNVQPTVGFDRPRNDCFGGAGSTVRVAELVCEDSSQNQFRNWTAYRSCKYRLCVGGANDGSVCTDRSQCSGGDCVLDRRTVAAGGNPSQGDDCSDASVGGPGAGACTGGAVCEQDVFYLYHPGNAIFPGAEYDLQALGEGCPANDPLSFSLPLTTVNPDHGDMASGKRSSPLAGWQPPSSPTDTLLLNDLFAILDVLGNKPDAPPKPWSEFRGSSGAALDGDVSIFDLFSVLEGVNGEPYAFVRPVIPVCP